METQKKVWKTPELIALVRSKPEEAVLNACKTAPGTTPGPSSNECDTNSGGGCSLLASS